MMENLDALMNSKNSLKMIQDDWGRASNSGIPNNTTGGDTIQINNNIYTLTPEIYRALTSTSYSGGKYKK